MTEHANGVWVIAATLLLGLVLSIWPVFDFLAAFWPHWVLLITIYWCLALPHRVGVVMAWIVGLLIDVLQASVLGEHALALALVAFIVHKLHIQVRMSPTVQKALIVASFVAFYEFILFLIHGVLGLPLNPMVRWMPTATSLLVWPLVFVFLRFLRRKYKVT